MTNTAKNTAQHVVEVLTAAGHSAFMVGGCVRDTVLGREPKDWDVCTSANPQQVSDLFPTNFDFVGAHFGVSLLKFDEATVEVATFRQDGDYSDGRRPDTVSFCSDVREDVSRRDFTMNALLMTATGEVVDHVNGLADLQAALVRCVGDADTRFEEDALRMLRAVRFCAQLGFELAPETFAAVCRNAHLVQQLSVERVAGELSKMLTSGRANAAFELLHSTGLMQFVLPELVPMFGCEHNSPEFHPEGDVANHTALLLAGLEKGCSLTLALAALLHDMGKPATRAEKANGRATFYGHEKVGAEMAEQLLHRLKFPNDVVATVCNHVANHMKFFAVRSMKRSTLLRFLREPNHAELRQLGFLDVRASNKDFSDLHFLEQFETDNAAVVHAKALVNGNDLIALGFVPGPQFKTMLTAVETEQFEGRVTTREAALEFLRVQLQRA